ncbi:MAG: alpha/beta hydrolase, partial [Kangiellaceae bacterium]
MTEELMLEGATGQLEAIMDLPQESIDFENSNYLAVCCHPHSLHGGTLTNKVVYTLSRSIASLGIPSIRFNFRGVGKSEGEYDGGIGEQDDLTKVVDWMVQQHPGKKLILGGFSFGAYVSIMAANKLRAN